MKDLLLRVRVVVNGTSNMKISRSRLADYVKILQQKSCCSTNIFLHSTNQIIDLWRCRWRCRRQILNSPIDAVNTVGVENGHFGTLFKGFIRQIVNNENETILKFNRCKTLLKKSNSIFKFAIFLTFHWVFICPISGFIIIAFSADNRSKVLVESIQINIALQKLDFTVTRFFFLN